ncbi:hypothetical protein DM806_09125 [Sphingobium lactosutens]|uniref:hypothetical protein n=1 Tax=Sphingobium lactosutens TaxID=522773 RepID=UPI0015BFDAE0|nr:hypothetical protein [Sphingobium lactosutens]NWK95835.1 hypothetical protein [Sphingobium lactosutens]
MARALVPDPSSLGMASPVIGAWFSDSGLSLTTPASDLSVTITPSGATKWQPPARGILSLYFATPTRPSGLALLRAANGKPAFSDNNLVALFRVLPEVEARLHALMKEIPSPDGSTATVPTRPAVRWFAIEATSITTSSTVTAIADLWPMSFPASYTDKLKLDEIGLDGTSGALTNGKSPATVLRGPGAIIGDGDALLSLDTSSFRLWAFDRRGRAIDPGAVAAWWAHLATTLFDNLWAGSGNQRTCAATAARNVHVVSAHEGPVAPLLLGRTTIGGASGTATDIVRAASGTAAVTVAFSTAPTPDTAPVPRAALLPHGRWTSTLNLWPSGPVATGLERDYARIALIDIEGHLTGQPRSPVSTTPTGGETRRAANQNRASTRVGVARAVRDDAAASVTRPSIDEAADGLVALLQGSAPALLVIPQLDRDYGPLQPLADDADPFPTHLPTPTTRALTGGGTATGTTIAGQRALLEFTLDPSLAGAMLRVWPNAVDLTNGRRKATDGGAGRVRADGKVSLVALLPDGKNDDSDLGATALLAHGGGTRLYGEIRFKRPLDSGGALLAWGSASGAIIACEQDRFANTGAVTGILPGMTLVHDDGATASLIDPATVPAAAFAADTVIRSLAANDRVLLTQPAFRTEPVGSPATTLAVSGATVAEQARDGVTRPSGPGTPLPSQQALTSAGVTFDATTARAVLLPPPALSRYHELGLAQSGHPGAPATTEVAGVGIDLQGPAALLFAEALGAVADAATPAMVAAALARTDMATDPNGAALWAAALRTQSAGVEGERGLDGEVTDSSHAYPFDGDEAAQRNWYGTHPSITIPAPASGREAVQQRALARRALAAGRGLQEGAIALKAAFERAEDFVYLETPALDLATIGSGEKILRPVQALADRLTAQPALHAVLCVPVDSYVNAPKDYARVRADALKSALTALDAAAPGRFATFCPSAGAGRSLRLMTTVVIVDDMFAMVGSTHLSRRGLSFDSSLSAALFDEQMVDGRCQAIVDLRRALIGARLGLDTGLVPDEGSALVRAVTSLTARGSVRLTVATIPPVDPPVTDSDRILWNRDGTVAPNPTDLTVWLTQLATGNVLN